MKSALGYTRVFEEDHSVRLVYMRTMDIVEDMLSSNFLSVNSRTTYLRYSRDSEMIVKYRSVLPLLVKQGKNTPVAKIFEITHANDPSLYTCSET